MASEFMCERCEDSGFITVRVVGPMSYVGPGSPPDGARGVCEVRCRWCDPVSRFREEMEDDDAD